MNWVDWRDGYINRLLEAGIDDPTTEIREIIARVTGKRGALLLFEKGNRVEDLLTNEELSLIEDAVGRRVAREPVDYVFGEAFFYRDSFFVGPGVLVPRRESELLVGAALRVLGVDTNFLFGRFEDVPLLSSAEGSGMIRIFDLCTGSGCIGISISNVLSNYLVSYRTALTEQSPDAAVYANRNIAAAREPQFLRLFQCDLFPEPDELAAWWGEEPADLIVANPPYITDAEIDGLMPEVSRYEPRIALSGGPDGLQVYRLILRRVRGMLRPGGLVVFEHGYDQRESLAKLLFEYGFRDIVCIRDYDDNDRVTAARYCPEAAL
ncbi:MAG: peptide chain release factor N(5)-glutamine methyltransferase [Clostridiaceae bacterium]|nr:peptide chain release factor N(5)-glutamine methyltransferase [Oscillospiraceae bacterium]NLO61837.1 peptide chain release factor N(5)-glutamine methyltransferase [Clostridiaceae bacterium]